MSSVSAPVAHLCWQIYACPPGPWLLYSRPSALQDLAVLSPGGTYTFVWGTWLFQGVVVKPLSVQRGRVVVEVHVPNFGISFGLVVPNRQLDWKDSSLRWTRMVSKLWPARVTGQNFQLPGTSLVTSHCTDPHLLMWSLAGYYTAGDLAELLREVRHMPVEALSLHTVYFRGRYDDKSRRRSSLQRFIKAWRSVVE